jgi:peptidoglycan/xylan/chitin deacetylase (PgdA/CDA1 family)
MPRLVVLIILILAGSGVRPAAAEEVALTFDDLPTLQLVDSTAYAAHTTERLLAGLRRHRLPAIGFVNEDKLEGADKTQRIALLRRWLDAGMELGNHTYSHESLTHTAAGAYVADIARGETVLRPMMAARGLSLHWFRHPYLETGMTLAARSEVEGWLSAHGYLVAPVTMENSDWMFALPYDDAIRRGDAAGARRVREAYLDYTARVVPWYRKAAFQLFARPPALVFLLHASRLNADSLDALTAILRSNDLRAISLDEAMTDPVYQTPDTYAGPDGDEWLSRWSLTLHRDLPWASFPQPPADIAAENDRLDPSP